MALAAVGLGWYADHRRIEHAHKLLDAVNERYFGDDPPPRYGFTTTINYRGRPFIVTVEPPVKDLDLKEFSKNLKH